MNTDEHRFQLVKASSCFHTMRGLRPTSSPEPRGKARRKGQGGEESDKERFPTGLG